MNKLEERHYKEWDELNVIIQAKAHATITKEIAIGFKNWYNEQFHIPFDFTDDQIFEMT